ncbi:hypothetical protein OKA05_13630 [Luteolibacter arcticus]|uniref:Antitoxin n=1 Tax=Luteolibacter arcticus TaxID=1581411 RepID=A0ABT3GJC5_9BACT|nr:hypothetical protein [Luteolibacter arcticus]MCW1923600.1 hypothetical protein [Luteolibacter arcticus]
MKTTLDLPAELVKAMKLRAVHEGRKLKDVAAELLERGLSAPPTLVFPLFPAAPKIEVQANGVPVIVCGNDAPASRMSTEELLALEQEALYQEDLERVGLSL